MRQQGLMNARGGSDHLESLLTVSNRRPKSNFDAKGASTNIDHREVTVDEALALV